MKQLRRFWHGRPGWWVVALLWVACGQNPAVPPPIATQITHVETAVPTPLPSATATRPPATATATLTPPPTVTPTLTPTPTALPLLVSGDPRALQLAPPVPQTGAPCGLVDVFDFPLQPPDAANISSGGRDFGIFRERFDKFHAGEDWWAANRNSSFGEPVYSIGHGLVTYAEPEGWNRDKGVVIVQHTFADGSRLLSFYGHLDPPSVTLLPGECVVRGQQIGQIGKPRGSPHLHFEIRQQSPYAPLTGYWPEDPTLVGWLPPSQTIWQQRIRAAPGVLWTRPFLTPGSHVLGVVTGTLVVLEDGQLVGIQVVDGRVRWRYTSETDISQAALDQTTPLVYLADQSGHIEAVSLLPTSEAELPSFTPLWQTQLAAVGSPTLIPLAVEGVLVSLRRDLFALGADGTVRWTAEDVGQPLAWAAAGEKMVLSTTSDDGPVWLLDAQSAQPLAMTGNGRFAATAAQTWFYRRDGLYHLNLETQTAELTYPLPPGMASLGDSAVLPDGGLLLAHADPFDRRLLAFAPDGSLRWERSYNGLVSGSVQLVVAGNRVYLLAHESDNAGYQLTVYVVEMEQMVLTRVFVGGSRSPMTADNWVMPIGENLILNIGGGPMFLLQPS